MCNNLSVIIENVRNKIPLDLTSHITEAQNHLRDHLQQEGRRTSNIQAMKSALGASTMSPTMRQSARTLNFSSRALVSRARGSFEMPVVASRDIFHAAGSTSLEQYFVQYYNASRATQEEESISRTFSMVAPPSRMSSTDSAENKSDVFTYKLPSDDSHSSAFGVRGRISSRSFNHQESIYNMRINLSNDMDV